MIGKGRLRHLTTVLDGCGVPAVNQRWFDAALAARVGCHIAWHRMRRVFVVYRHRGNHAQPRTYLDVGPRNWPLNSAALDVACDAVRWADAKLSRNADRMLDVMRRRQADEDKRAQRSFIAERFPDFYKDMQRIKEVISDGRYRQKYHDLGALRRAV